MRSVPVQKVTTALLCFITGCASATSSTGPAIDRTQVSEIKKGITTRAEILERFGSPITTQIMGDGRRELVFVSTESQIRNDNRVWIPFAGPFMATNNRYSTHSQQLQVIIGKNDVVEDYEFSDQTSQTKTRASAFGGSAQTETKNNN